MKSRENLVRLKQFQVNEKRRQLVQLDMMIAEFDRMASELEVQITAEEKQGRHHRCQPLCLSDLRQGGTIAPRQSEELAIRSRPAEECRRSHTAEAEAELSKAEMLESRDSKSRDNDQVHRSAMIG